MVQLIRIALATVWHMPFCIERDDEDIWLRTETPRAKGRPLRLARRYPNIGDARSAAARISKASKNELRIVEVPDDAS
jgi:hypothetical protein